jgi:N-acetylneuraminic acid mutarotase
MKSLLRVSLTTLALCIALLSLMGGVAHAAGWRPTGDTVYPHEGYGSTATLLQDGQVLVVGGFDATSPNYGSPHAELYDPSTGTWTATADANFGHYEHTATLLEDGRVLVAGGHRFLSETGLLYEGKAEIYDPGTATWTVTGSMSTGRVLHTATLLDNGKVLVAGGYNGGSRYGNISFSSAELYDPATRTWSLTGSLNARRLGHTMTKLSDGTVLVAGGYGPPDLKTAEIYNPDAGTWSYTGTMNFSHSYQAATLLSDARVLITGGGGIPSEIYDPATGEWSVTGSMNVEREYQAAVLLHDGRVLVVGGTGSPSTSAEIYNPHSGDWRFTADMNTARYFVTLTALDKCTVLVVGSTITPTSAELFTC